MAKNREKYVFKTDLYYVYFLVVIICCLIRQKHLGKYGTLVKDMTIDK